jgi:hypothetical protein
MEHSEYNLECDNNVYKNFIYLIRNFILLNVQTPSVKKNFENILYPLALLPI